MNSPTPLGLIRRDALAAAHGGWEEILQEVPTTYDQVKEYNLPTEFYGDYLGLLYSHTLKLWCLVGATFCKNKPHIYIIEESADPEWLIEDLVPDRRKSLLGQGPQCMTCRRWMCSCLDTPTNPQTYTDLSDLDMQEFEDEMLDPEYPENYNPFQYRYEEEAA